MAEHNVRHQPLVTGTVFAHDHQRLGDLVAGTLVVRAREPEMTPWNDSPNRTCTAQIFSPPVSTAEPHTRVSLPDADVAKLSTADLEVLESFFARRLDMPLATRQMLGERIAAAIRAKSGLAIPTGVSTETFLEAVGRQLRDVGRLR